MSYLERLDGGPGDCLDEFGARHIFFKSHSAALWRNEGRWQLLQREGYAGGCLAGGGRFYYAGLVSNYFQGDMGLCAPASCEGDDVSYYYFSSLHHGFFLQEDIQFAVHLRAYQGLSIERLAALPGAVLAILAFTFLLALLGSGFRQRTHGHGAGPLQAIATLALIAREVVLRTRWQSYRFHESSSILFAAARLAVGSAEAVFLLARAVQITRAVMPSDVKASGLLRLFLRAAGVLMLRLAEMACLSLAWTVVAHATHALCVVNIFSVGAWISPDFADSMAKCAGLGPFDALSIGLLAETDQTPCPHLQPLRMELELLSVLAPLLLVCSVLGPLSACLLAWVLTAVTILSPEPQLAAVWVPGVFAIQNFAIAGFALFVAWIVQRSPKANAALDPLSACEPGMAGAVLAAPLVLFALEGYAEPHAKALTFFDFFSRLAGVFVLSFTAGTIAASACEGLARLGLLAVGALGACGRMLGRSPVLRLSLELRSGKRLVSFRFPVAAASLFGLAVALAWRFLAPTISAEWM